MRISALFTRLAPTGLLLSLLLGCASTAPQDTAPAQPQPEVAETAAAPPAEPAPEPEAEIKYGNFTEEQLYQALISEIGAQRGSIAEAGENYFDLAFDTRDEAIIRRAMQFAGANDDDNALLQLGMLWAEVAPDNPQPQLMLAFEFLENGNFAQALSHMARVISLGGDFDFTNLASRTGDLDRNRRSQLIATIRDLRSEYAGQRSLQLALVQLLAQNQQFEDALVELDDLVAQHGNESLLIRLRAQIYQNQGKAEQVADTLRRGVREFPQDRDLRHSWARFLVQEERLAEAREQFQFLVEQDATDWETWYSIALLDMEMQRLESAREILMRLVGAGQNADEAQFYLGYINEELQQPARAVEHYRQVRIGTNNYLNAQQQATRLSIELGELEDAHAWLMSQSRGQPRLEVLFTSMESNLLIQNGQPEAAHELLDRALDKYPSETELLFARVLLNDSMGDRVASERDLRRIINLQPDDSRALNHLGYMLADQTDRHEEALALIEQAIALSPDDPAIIDSLGWAQYKLGLYEEALQNLRRAFAAFPNHEVASHLGEVLWQMGREDEARQIWQQGLQDRADSPIIEEAMDRLIPD